VERLRYLIGEWDIQPYLRRDDGTWVPGAPNRTTIKPLYGGTFLQEDVTINLGTQTHHFFIVWSYDQFRQVFRMVVCDDVSGLMDVYEGNFVGQTIIVSNLYSGTSTIEPDGASSFFRLCSTRTDQNHFTDELQLSTDQGVTWLPLYRAAHTRLSGGS
jgi:hypothetical protein